MAPGVGTDFKGDLLGRVDARTRGRRLHWFDVVLGAVLIVFGILMLAPLYWLISTSFTVGSEAFAEPPKWLPIPFTLQNFIDVFEYVPFGQQFLNSVLLAVIVTVGSLTFSVLAAYGFARVAFRGSGPLLVVIL